MAFKELFFKFTSPVSGIMPSNSLRRLTQIHAVFPLYHAVGSPENKPHLKYLYKIRTEKEFEQDLDMLLKHYHPLPLEDIITQIKQGLPFKKPVFHLTFDDGLREFYDIAAPLLRRKGIPATCFLNNDFIDNKDMFFRFKAAILIDHLHHQGNGAAAWKVFHEWMKHHDLPGKYYRTILLSLRLEHEGLLDELATKIDVDFNAFLTRERPYLDSPEILELKGDGFTFGAHTARHPDMYALDVPLQIDAIRASVDDLQSRFQLSYRVFSFPFTDHGVGAEVFRHIHDEKIVDLSFGCAGIKKDIIPGHLQRIPIEIYGRKMQIILKAEYLYYLMLKISGRSVIRR